MDSDSHTIRDRLDDLRIENLKDQKRRQLRTDPAVPLKEDFNASNLMEPELYLAIRSKTKSAFISTLEKLCGRRRHKSGHVSDIVEEVTRGGKTILHLAVQHGRRDILGLMANHFPQLIIKTNITGDSALHFAARMKDLYLTSLILRYNEDHFGNQEKNLLRMKNEFGNTALHEAVITSNHHVVCCLFEADPVVANYLNKEGKSPLYLAVENGQDDTIKILLKAAPLNRERHHGTSPLHAAIMRSSGGKRKYKHSSLLDYYWKPDQLCKLSYQHQSTTSDTRAS